MSERTLREAAKKNHPTMWHVYEKHMERALNKVGATHVAWVASPDLTNTAVQDIESDLIQTLNPRANISHRVPRVIFQYRTKEVVAEFRSLIHEHRSDGYTIPVLQVD